MVRFKDRTAGAEVLLPRLRKFVGNKDVVLVGLPRGGMITASYIAQKLGLPLGFLIVKKIGAPGDPELAIGAVSESGETYFDEGMVRLMSISPEYLRHESGEKMNQAVKRSDLYTSNYSNTRFKGKTVILVDDGMATGTTMLTAIRSAKSWGAKNVVVAVPIASIDATEKVKKEAELIALETDSTLASVGEFYDNFPQVEDGEVLKILKYNPRTV